MEIAKVQYPVAIAILGVLIGSCSASRVSHVSRHAGNATHDSDATNVTEDVTNANLSTTDSLVSEYYNANIGIAYTMVSPGGWRHGSWFMVDRLRTKPDCSQFGQAYHSIMTSNQPMGTYKGLSYGLAFHITEES